MVAVIYPWSGMAGEGQGEGATTSLEEAHQTYQSADLP